MQDLCSKLSKALSRGKRLIVPGILCATLMTQRATLLAHEGGPDGSKDAGTGVVDSGCAQSASPPAKGEWPDSEAQGADCVELSFRDFYRTPLGPRGLEFTDRIRALEGRRVRVAGYMVQSRNPVPGTLLLTPYPVKMDDCHYGLADDLPPQTLHVTVPALKDQPVPFVRGLLSLTGRLELGPKEQPDGRNFAVRLIVDTEPASGGASGQASAPARPAAPRVAGGTAAGNHCEP